MDGKGSFNNDIIQTKFLHFKHNFYLVEGKLCLNEWGGLVSEI